MRPSFVSSINFDTLEKINSYLPARDMFSLASVSKEDQRNQEKIVRRKSEMSRMVNEKYSLLSKRIFDEVPLLSLLLPCSIPILHTQRILSLLSNSSYFTLKGRKYGNEYFGSIECRFFSSNDEEIFILLTSFNDFSLLDGDYFFFTPLKDLEGYLFFKDGHAEGEYYIIDRKKLVTSRGSFQQGKIIGDEIHMDLEESYIFSRVNYLYQGENLLRREERMSNGIIIEDIFPSPFHRLKIVKHSEYLSEQQNFEEYYLVDECNLLLSVMSKENIQSGILNLRRILDDLSVKMGREKEELTNLLSSYSFSSYGIIVNFFPDLILEYE